MTNSVVVKLQTGFFERTPFKLKITAEGLAFRPSTNNHKALSIPAADIKSVTFYENRLKLEIEARVITEVYFTNSIDWLYAMKALKETLQIKILCEMN